MSFMITFTFDTTIVFSMYSKPGGTQAVILALQRIIFFKCYTRESEKKVYKHQSRREVTPPVQGFLNFFSHAPFSVTHCYSRLT